MFALTYFVAESESMHLAVSADGLMWHPLDAVNPVVAPTGPVSALRDPFVAVGRDGRFHMLATNGWTSTSIVHAVSDNLLTWTTPRRVPVMAPIAEARNAWAPEFFIDETKEEHVVIWSSAIEPIGAGWDSLEAASTTTHEQRIWSSRTADFETWTQPSIWFDPGYSVIDATVMRVKDRWMMAFKDERGENDDPGGYKGIRITGFDNPDGPFDPPSKIVSERLVEGPTFVQAEDRLLVLFDHFLRGAYGAIESRDGTTWAPAAGLSVPPGARHASALQVPEDIFRVLSVDQFGVEATSNNKP